jgi:transcription antitermination factor NusG
MVVRMDRDERPGWIILRTAPASTLNLAKSLTDAGFEVWTPIEEQVRRLARQRKEVERKVPIMPTFVFARDVHQVELSLLAGRALKAQPSFSIFRHAGRIPVIKDASLGQLRSAEVQAEKRAEARRSAIKRKERCQLSKGTTVTVESGAFAGLTGVVERTKGSFAVICFGGRYEFEISSWLLKPNEAHSSGKPALGTAA